MAYRPSFARKRWQADRGAALDVLARAHVELGEVDGPGRPLKIGRPIAHAYVLRLVAEFQGFARDLHGLAVDRLVELSRSDPRSQPLLVAAATEGRFIDRGNADLRSIRNDFRRLGITELDTKLAARNGYWRASPRRRGDRSSYGDLIEVRNALAHGNEGQLRALRSRGVLDTVTWARSRLPGLDRFAHALDRVVWEHLEDTFGTEPW